MGLRSVVPGQSQSKHSSVACIASGPRGQSPCCKTVDLLSRIIDGLLAWNSMESSFISLVSPCGWA